VNGEWSMVNNVPHAGRCFKSQLPNSIVYHV